MLIDQWQVNIVNRIIERFFFSIFSSHPSTQNMSILSRIGSFSLFPRNVTTSQKVSKQRWFAEKQANDFETSLRSNLTEQIVVLSLTAGVALLTVLARYLGRRKASRPVRRARRVGGRRTRNSMRSPNGKISRIALYAPE